MFLFFFFQAEDGIRDLIVTGVQTCALPICVGEPAARAGDERIHPLRRRLRFRLERLHGKGGPAERLRVGLGEPARESARLAPAAQDPDEAMLLHGLGEQPDARWADPPGPPRQADPDPAW